MPGGKSEGGAPNRRSNRSSQRSSRELRWVHLTTVNHCCNAINHLTNPTPNGEGEGEMQGGAEGGRRGGGEGRVVAAEL